MLGNHPLTGGWNSFGTFSRPFRSSGLSSDEALVPFDGRWDGFAELVPQADELAAMDDAALCARFGIPERFLAQAVPAAIAEWRQSPSRSLINVVAGVRGHRPSGAMFADILTQTRVLAAAASPSFLPPHLLRGIKGEDGRPLRVSHDAFAATLDNEGVTLLNDIARWMMAWELRNRARVDTGLVRLPRVIYRGIRGSTVATERLAQREGEGHDIWQCRWIEMKMRALGERPLAEVSGTPILSFTSEEAVAQRFTKGEGIIVEIDPSRVMVVASWSTDAALAGKDAVLKRHEKEWIVRVDPGYVLAPEEIRPWERTLAYCTNDPAGIGMLHHEDVASYRLEGRHVEAFFRYNSNGVGGRIVFQVGDAMTFAKGRMTWRKEQGFDPLPGPGREAEGLRYFRRSRYLDRGDRPFASYEREAGRSPEP